MGGNRVVLRTGRSGGVRDSNSKREEPITGKVTRYDHRAAPTRSIQPTHGRRPPSRVTFAWSAEGQVRSPSFHDRFFEPGSKAFEASARLAVRIVSSRAIWRRQGAARALVRTRERQQARQNSLIQGREKMMHSPSFVYVTYIETTRKAVEALTSANSPAHLVNTA